MPNNDVKFRVNIDVDGQKKIVDVSTDVSHLADEFDKARTESTKLRDDLLKYTQTAQSFQNIANGLRELTGIFGEYTSAASAQEELETKLSVNMRNTMDAREEDIASIKNLISAQQQLGVVGDEVQLAGAQELATYLEKKASLEKLIPVMNDMIAQQDGINATQENATNIATMLGKVMDGQVGALLRYGYKFDEAQEEILKFGTEAQRAAVLAEVVESAVGGMNEELGKTDAGKAKHVADFIGDIKKQIGSVFAVLEPGIVTFNELGSAVNAFSNTYNGIKGVTVALSTFSSTVKMSTITTYAHAAASKVASAAHFLWSKQLYYGRQASIAWAFGAKLATAQAIVMRGAIMGLMAVTGVGLAIMAVSSIVSLFASGTDAATASMKGAEDEARRLKAAEQSTSEAYSSVNATLEINQAKLKSLIDLKERGVDTSSEEKKIVGELNSTYGETMGYFSSVSQWYNALTKNSKAYCEQMILEAETRQLANQIAEMESDKYNLLYDENGKKHKYSTKRKQKAVYVSGGDYVYDYKTGDMSPKEIKYEDIVGSSDFEKATAKLSDYNKKLNNLRSRLQGLATQAGKIKMPVVGSATAPTQTGTTTPGTTNTPGNSQEKQLQLIADARTYEDLMNNVSYYEEQLKKTDKTETQSIARLQQLRDAARAAADGIMKSGENIASVNYGEDTIEGIDNKISLYGEAQQRADAGRIYELQQEIDRLTEKRRMLSVGIDIASFEEHLNGIRTGEASIDELTAKMKELQKLLANTDFAFGGALETKLKQLISRYGMLIGVSEAHGRQEESNQKKLSKLDGMSAAAASVEQLAQSFQSLGEESKSFAGSMVVVSLAASLSQLIAGMVKKANESTLTIWDWIAGIGAGTAAAVSAATQLKSIGVFAKGGVVSGPTLALVGEYAGASSNPEVIAPLNKLRGMLRDESDGMGGEVVFKLKYDQLEGVLQRGRRKSMRS